MLFNFLICYPSFADNHNIYDALELIKKDLKTLILKRNSKGPRDGLWEFPGGKIEKGESELSCVIREVKEETGVKELVLNKFEFKLINFNFTFLPFK